jgi:DNA-binding transcriptional regulator/RsmH inhibitor MraZ
MPTLGCRSQAVSLDAKRRFMLPLSFRGPAPEDGVHRFYLGFERDPCLYLHTEPQHDEYVKGLSALFDDADERERDALRAILASFSRVSTDAQGRLTLGEVFVEWGGLNNFMLLLANAIRI